VGGGVLQVVVVRAAIALLQGQQIPDADRRVEVDEGCRCVSAIGSDNALSLSAYASRPYPDSTLQEAEHDRVTKQTEYLAGGLAECYILHHEQTLCAFYSSAMVGQYEPLAAQEGIIQFRVLPGFRFRLGR
jgi:hypothetical protein